MVRKLAVGFLLAIVISNCFAGYSGGGRSGYSGGRGFGSSRSFSYGRSGYSRSTNTSRAYVAPRTYVSPRTFSRGYSNTVIHNNYSHGGYGGFGGGGFFNGFLGGYMGATLAGSHGHLATSGVPMDSGIGQGQGMLMEGAQPYAVSSSNGIFYTIFGTIMALFLSLVLIGCAIAMFSALFDSGHNRW